MVCFVFGGRLRKSYLNDDCKHAELLPKEKRVALLIMQYCHSKCAHGGRRLTMNELRSCGYFIVIIIIIIIIITIIIIIFISSWRKIVKY